MTGEITIFRPKFRMTFVSILMGGCILLLAFSIPRHGNILVALRLIATCLAILIAANLFYFGWRIEVFEAGICKTYLGLFRRSLKYKEIHTYQFGVMGMQFSPDSPFAFGLELYSRNHALLMRIPQKTLSNGDIDRIRQALDARGVLYSGSR